MTDQTSEKDPTTPPNTPVAPATDRATTTAVQASAPPSGKPDEPAKPSATAERDPLRELLDRMERLHPILAHNDPSLARTMHSLVQQGADPDRHAQPKFRHDVAYALQDLEKTAVGRIELPPDLRSEMTRLANSAPGLENERMLALMRATASIEDKSLLGAIRHAGQDIGRQVDQNHPNLQSRIDVIENRVRLTCRPTEPDNPALMSNADPQPRAASGQHRAAERDRPAANNSVQSTAARNDAGPQNPDRGQQVMYSRSPLNTILRGMRAQNHGAGAPWDPPLTPMAERLSAFEKQMTEAYDERAFENALRSGRTALDAIQAFSNREGASIMNRINAAARAEPGGIASVLSDMREGGRFADLRKQFSNALATDLGLAGAYDKAASALARYGQDRAGVQDIIGRRADPTAITQRFEEMDAEIGKAAANTPSRNDGRSMLDDLSQKTAELLHRAVDAVKSAFSRSPSASAAAQPSPSPSMSA